MRFEDRQTHLGHKAAHVTTHYAAADIENLISFAEKVCELVSRKSPALSIVEVGRSIASARKFWWKGRESNPRPRHYECRALTS